MENINSLNDKLARMQAIAQRYPNGDFDKTLREIQYFRDNFNTKVLFIGHFSAGKSALLNGLLGRRNFLTEAQTPQTALATELWYTSGEEKAIAITNDGEKAAITPEQELDATGYMHAEFAVNAEALGKLQKYVIVDTPGFDSGIENHNKALSNYIGQGSAFMLVLEVERGTIDSRSLSFLQEVSGYSNNIAILLNKCDKVTPEIAAVIKKQVEETLAASGYSYPVYTVSAYDENISQTLVDIISAFNVEEIFCQRFGNQIYRGGQEISAQLTNLQNAVTLDTDDLDEKIDDFENNLQNFDSIVRSLHRTGDNSTVQASQIVDAIKSELASKSDQIINTFMAGSQEGVNEIIMGTARPIIMDKLLEYSMEIIDETADKITQYIDLSSEDADAFEQTVSSIRYGLQEQICNGNFSSSALTVPGENLLEVSANRIENEDRDKSDRLSMTYTAVAGVLAACTNIVAPWVEVLVVMAPHIIDFVNGIRATTRSRRVEEEFQNKVQNTVIPQAAQSFYQPVLQALTASRKNIIEQMNNLCRDQLEKMKNTLTEIRNEKKNKEQAYSSEISSIDNDVAALTQILTELEENG